MKIKFEKAKMLEKLVRAMGAVSQKNTHPFTEGVLLETCENGLKMSTYDMEKSVRALVEAEIIIEGACVINAQRLLSIVRILPESVITLTVDENLVVNIKSGRSSFSLHALAAKDFPQMPVIAGRESFTIEQCALKKMIVRTAHSIAQIDKRPILCGAFFKLEQDNIRVVSCDSYTLSLCNLRTPIVTVIDNLERTSFIVPGKTVTELVKMLSDEPGEFVTIMVTNKNIIFNMENLVFSSRLVEGEYIDYDRLIPRDQPIEAILDAKEFQDALERAALISEEKIAGSTKNYVKLSFVGNSLQITSKSANGDIFEEIEAEHTGNDIEIGFNCRYLIDTMRSVNTEKIKVKLITPNMSATIEPIDDEAEDQYIYMVLPLKMKE
ncbi:MAG: DNA polymerase III subunit beta [Clostridia bacterium]|nr:DNA polymerase III subunit beta [Clostridia bacterium]